MQGLLTQPASGCSTGVDVSLAKIFLFQHLSRRSDLDPHLLEIGSGSTSSRRAEPDHGCNMISIIRILFHRDRIRTCIFLEIGSASSRRAYPNHGCNMISMIRIHLSQRSDPDLHFLRDRIRIPIFSESGSGSLLIQISDLDPAV